MRPPSSPRVPRSLGSNTRHVRHTRNTTDVLVSASQPDFAEPLGTARIAWQLQRINGSLVRRRTKTTSSDAVLPLPELCLAALRERQNLESRWRTQAAEAWQVSGLVLTTKYGMPIDPRNFHRMFKARARKADVPEISVHSARRTCASLLVALNVHPRVAMSILRHSQIAVTMDIYAQATADGTRSAVQELGASIGSNGR